MLSLGSRNFEVSIVSSRLQWKKSRLVSQSYDVSMEQNKFYSADGKYIAHSNTSHEMRYTIQSRGIQGKSEAHRGNCNHKPSNHNALFSKIMNENKKSDNAMKNQRAK